MNGFCLRSRWRALFASTALLLGALAPAAQSAHAYIVPNLVAVASPDEQMAVGFAATANARTVADAGAFASLSTQQYGLVGIPSWDPVTEPNSYLVCEMPVVNALDDELVTVYGLQGVGVQEAIVFCSGLESNGTYIRWRLN